jgi:hypothetical protein
MAYRLGDLLFEVYDALGQATSYAATGGSTTTVVKLGTGIEDSDLSGTILIRETTDDAAPEGEFREVTDYNSTTGTFTVSPSFSAVVESGDIFAFASPLYPTQQMVESCNRGLRALGDIDLVDTTTLDSASNQTEYDAELVWKRRKPLRIDIQTNTSDANDNRWVQLYDWEFIPAAAGSKGLIVFHEQLPSGRDLRIWYRDVHPRLSDFDDVISEMLQPELVLASAKLKALEWQASRGQGSEPFIVELLNKAQTDLANIKQEFPVAKSSRTPLITSIPRGGRRNDPGEPGKVPLGRRY